MNGGAAEILRRERPRFWRKETHEPRAVKLNAMEGTPTQHMLIKIPRELPR